MTQALRALAITLAALALLGACASPGRISPSEPLVQRPAPGDRDAPRAPTPAAGQGEPASLPLLRWGPAPAAAPPALAPRALPERPCLDAAFHGSPELLHRPPAPSSPSCQRGLRWQW
jgi:hypothetical protein